MQIAFGQPGSIAITEAEVIERHALTTGDGRNLRPYTVRLADGRELTVTDDEGDGRCIPGEHGPAREGKYGWSYA